MSARRSQPRHKRKQQRAEDEEFMDDGATSGQRSRDSRRQPPGKAGKRHKQERRRSRRREEGSAEDDFANFPWEELFESDMGMHLAEILAGFARLKSRIGNNVSWIALSRVLYEVLLYVDTYILNGSFWIALLSISTLCVGVICVNATWTSGGRGYHYAVLRMVFGSFFSLVGFTLLLSLWQWLMPASSLSAMLQVLTAVFAIQLGSCYYMSPNSFEFLDVTSLVATYTIVQLGYPATITYGDDHDRDFGTVVGLWMVFGFTLGFGKLFLALTSAHGGYHRVTLGKGFLTTWMFVIVAVLCRFPYGCVLFHLVCRYMTLVFYQSSSPDSKLGQTFKLSGEPAYDLIHAALEVLMHAIGLGVLRYSVALVVLVGICYLSYRWGYVLAIYRLSARSLVACLTLTVSLRILSAVIHWFLDWFPLWVSCLVEVPLLIVALCIPKLLSFLSLYQPPSARLA